MERDPNKKTRTPWKEPWCVKFGEEPEDFWRLDQISDMLLEEHPDWSQDVVADMAQQVFDAQQKLYRDWYNSQRRFHYNATCVGRNAEEADDPDDDLSSL